MCRRICVKTCAKFSSKCTLHESSNHGGKLLKSIRTCAPKILPQTVPEEHHAVVNSCFLFCNNSYHFFFEMFSTLFWQLLKWDQSIVLSPKDIKPDFKFVKKIGDFRLLCVHSLVIALPTRAPLPAAALQIVCVCWQAWLVLWQVALLVPSWLATPQCFLQAFFLFKLRGGGLPFSAVSVCVYFAAGASFWVFWFFHLCDFETTKEDCFDICYDCCVQFGWMVGWRVCLFVLRCFGIFQFDVTSFCVLCSCLSRSDGEWRCPSI